MKHCRSRAKGYKFFMLNSAEHETNFKVGVRGSTSGVYITRTCLHDNFQIWSYTYLNSKFSICTCVAEGLRQGLDIERSKVRTLCDFYFVYSLFLFFYFFHLVWKFDVLFDGLLVIVVFFLMVTLSGRGRYYY